HKNQRFMAKINTLIGKGLLLSGLLAFFLIGGQGVMAQDGEKLFKANCASCHKIDKKLIGPALAGSEERWGGREKLYPWIKNSTQYLKDNPGDAYAQGLFEEYNKSIMTAQALSNGEIDAILDYIAVGPAAKSTADAGAAPVDAGGNASANDNTNNLIMTLAIVLLIVIYILMTTKRALSKVLAQVRGDAYTAGPDGIGEWLNRNKTVAVFGGLALLAALSVQGWFALKGVGVYEGYAPEQPIKFSHKIHAGDNKIDCQYCHHSAYKGKNAGIPSVNVCMNCHNAVQEGKRWGKEEISKIYEAAGFDPDQNMYTKEPKPVKWVRIHNLPDHAYFNHSQHVVVGKQKCQTCHGPVEEYDYPMRQFSELTMGWCINCHRETEVSMEGNAYYDKIHKDLLEKYKDKGIQKFTVEHIGGLECAKCHY
ncbi:MAG: c-type cytochrome, partial [Flavobacteriales bacterium]|nr:c-type cytochrome [Flavobacteriales bacterium]